jgi:hypothetical protein
MMKSSRLPWQHAPEILRHPVRAMEERPYRSGGLLVFLLVAIGLTIWVGPELRRYLRIERM